jgi:hypothetical protein
LSAEKAGLTRALGPGSTPPALCGPELEGRITGAGLDPSGTPAGFPANGSGGEGCWGEAADAEPNVVVEVGRVVAVPVGRAAVVGFVEPGAAAQQLGDPPKVTLRLAGRVRPWKIGGERQPGKQAAPQAQGMAVGQVGVPAQE